MASSEEKGSKRPDGTYRKVIKIREGYIAPDEVASYTAPMVRAAANEAVVVSKRPTIPGLPVSVTQPKATKPKKRPVISGNNASVNPNESSGTAPANPVSSPAAGKVENAAGEPCAEDPVKKVKQLSKKLRQIQDIKGKVDSGEVSESDLNADQKEKLSKLGEIEAEIARLTI